MPYFGDPKAHGKRCSCDYKFTLKLTCSKSTVEGHCDVPVSTLKEDVVLPENVRDAVFKAMATLPAQRRTIPEVFDFYHN